MLVSPPRIFYEHKLQYIILRSTEVQSINIFTFYYIHGRAVCQGGPGVQAPNHDQSDLHVRFSRIQGSGYPHPDCYGFLLESWLKCMVYFGPSIDKNS